MARPKLNLVVMDPGSGRAKPGAWVSFYSANTLALASVYADDDVSTLPNPVQANGLGEVAVRIAPGLYDVTMAWDGAQSRTVEDVLAWTPEAVVITTQGDLIVGDSAGTASRLPVGVVGQVLVVEDGTPTWSSLGAGHGLPAGVAGSLLGYGAGGTLTILPPGVQDQALAMAGGAPTWVSSLLPPGATLPISTPGDLVIGSAAPAGVPARLGVGTTGQVLRVAGGLPAWETFSAFGNPMTTLGDVIVGGASGAATRLPVGVPEDVLTVSAGNVPEWRAFASLIGRGIGQCRLEMSGADLLLRPYNGNLLWIDGKLRTIQTATPVQRAPTGLTINTNYYIYARWDGTTIVLEPSTQVYANIDGLHTKADDPTWTLVGFARVFDGPTVPEWKDVPTHRYVLSWFNRRALACDSQFSANRSTTSTVLIELHQEIRSHFLCWADTVANASLTGRVINSAVSQNTITNLALNGVSQGGMVATAAIANESTNIAMTFALQPGETNHYITLMARVNLGLSATWTGDVANLNVCRTQVVLAG